MVREARSDERRFEDAPEELLQCAIYTVNQWIGENMPEEPEEEGERKLGNVKPGDASDTGLVDSRAAFGIGDAAPGLPLPSPVR